MTLFISVEKGVKSKSNQYVTMYHFVVDVEKYPFNC